MYVTSELLSIQLFLNVLDTVTELFRRYENNKEVSHWIRRSKRQIKVNSEFVVIKPLWIDLEIQIKS